MKKSVTISKPDDFHLHIRDGKLMEFAVCQTAKVFSRALIMPNLVKPVATVKQAESYKKRILEALPSDSTFQPLMTLYITAETTKEDIKQAAANEFIYAMKLFPAGATTNSASGIQSIEEIREVLEWMEKLGMVLSMHGEVVDAEVDIFDRETVFIDRVLTDLLRNYPDLKMVMEHLTTSEAVKFVEESGENLAATITPHHLHLNRNDLLSGGIKPHLYCLPIVKKESDRQALVDAATSGNPKFFLGTDSAPHPQSSKETSSGSAGIFSAHAALFLYAEIFNSVNKMDKLEGFASYFGADFYGLERNQKTITLTNEKSLIPNEFIYDEEKIIPFKAGEQTCWQVTK